MKYEMDLIDAKDEGVAIGVKKGQNQGLGQGIAGTAKALATLKLDDEKIVHKLIEIYHLSYEDAQHYVE